MRRHINSKNLDWITTIGIIMSFNVWVLRYFVSGLLLIPRVLIVIFVIIVTYNAFYHILNKSHDHWVDVTRSNSKIVLIMVFSIALLLSMSITMQSQLAGARKRDSSDGNSPESQQIDQKMKCTSDAICLAKAINILCMKNSLCYIGYNAPFLMSTPHWQYPW